MTPDHYSRLLDELKGLQKKIAADLLSQARKEGPVRQRLLVRHREEEVGGSFDDWLKIASARSGVQFLLRTVYVRVLEDLGLLDPLRIRGQAGWQAFRSVAPGLGRRSFFRWVFRDLAHDFPDLFTPGADEPGLPSEGLCETVWALWHSEEGGSLVYELSDEDFDSRFLGDLYQDLDEDVQKRFALCQTPRFVEKLILDYTLTPALAEFDPQRLLEEGDAFRLLDPTCGSGHFLIGAFDRLLTWWTGHFAKAPVDWRIARALESVWGSDVNPYAVAVARFRLLLAVRHAGAREGVAFSLHELAAMKPNLLVADTLVPWEGTRGQTELWEESDPRMVLLSRYASASERKENAEFFDRAFHAVVGNPPYVSARDAEKRETYRLFWPQSAYRKFTLAVPFIERFLRLPVHSGFCGLIVSNAFGWREYGRLLVEKVLPTIDLTHVVDTHGADIPGHPTPTVILFARQRKPTSDQVRLVLGTQGDPDGHSAEAGGAVWTSIASALVNPGFRSRHVTVSETSRTSLARHPWTIGSAIEDDVIGAVTAAGRKSLGSLVTAIGVVGMSNADEMFFLDRRAAIRQGLASDSRPVVIGDAIRDFSVAGLGELRTPWPYGVDGRLLSPPPSSVVRVLWPWRTTLWARVVFGGETYRAAGRPWYAWHQLASERLELPQVIAFAFIATHNHYARIRDRVVYNRSAPIVALPSDAPDRSWCDLLGLLNSSLLGFWLRKVSFPQGVKSLEPWMDRRQFDSTKVERAPISDRDVDERVRLVIELERHAVNRLAASPGALLTAGHWSPSSLRSALEAARAEYISLTERMVALQEELDWLTYRSYGLLERPPMAPPEASESLGLGHRPFEILLARQRKTEEVRTEWFARHCREAVTDFPSRYIGAQRARLEERLAIIESNEMIRLLEQPQFKRRWQVPDLAVDAKEACETWLLDRIEDLFSEDGPLRTPRPCTLEEISAALRVDPRVPAVLEVYSGSATFEFEGIVGRLLAENALPDNPFRLYTAEGIRKLRRWQWVWEMQELEDSYFGPHLFLDPETGMRSPLIPVAPKFDKKDFRKGTWSQTRGEQNVPRERFILFADLEPVRFGWNGWRDADRAAAQAAAADIAMNHPVEPLPEAPTLDDPRRCGPTVGLWESLPDLRRWAGREIFEEQSELARYLCGKSACPCEVVEAWMARQEQGGRPGKAVDRKKPASAAPAEVPLERRLAVLKILSEAGEAGFTLAEVAGKLSLAEPDARAALLALVAEGSVEEHGRKKRYRIVRAQETLFP